MNSESLLLTSPNETNFYNGTQTEAEGFNFVSNYETQKRVIIILMFSVIIVVSLFGNALVCYVALKRRLRMSVNIFIANLSFSDLLLTIFLPINIFRAFELYTSWPFGHFLCASSSYVQSVSVYVSTLSMTTIALDRYRKFVTPFNLSITSKLPSYYCVAIIWILAFVFSIPFTFYSISQVPLSTNSTIIVERCVTHYPKSLVSYKKLISLVTFLTTHIIPLLITTVLYAIIIFHIWRTKQIGHVTQEQFQIRNRRKRKTIKMLILVVITFAICWMPLQFYRNFIGSNEYKLRCKSKLYFFVYWLAMSSVCYNPFIYCWLNSTFRQGVHSVLNHMLCLIPCCKLFRECLN